MRAVSIAITAFLLASCATTTPRSDVTKVYDHKYNTTHYVANQSQSEFVGTSASAPNKAQPSWYKFGHP